MRLLLLLLLLLYCLFPYIYYCCAGYPPPIVFQREYNNLAIFLLRTTADLLVGCRTCPWCFACSSSSLLLSKRYVFRYASACLPDIGTIPRWFLKLFIWTDVYCFAPSFRRYVFRYFAHMAIMPAEKCLGFPIKFNNFAFHSSSFLKSVAPTNGFSNIFVLAWTFITGCNPSSLTKS